MSSNIDFNYSLFNRCDVVDNSVNFQYEKIYCFNYPLDTLKIKFQNLKTLRIIFKNGFKTTKSIQLENIKLTLIIMILFLLIRTL